MSERRRNETVRSSIGGSFQAYLPETPSWTGTLPLGDGT